MPMPSPALLRLFASRSPLPHPTPIRSRGRCMCDQGQVLVVGFRHTLGIVDYRDPFQPGFVSNQKKEVSNSRSE